MAQHELMFEKALHLIDRGDVERGEAILREVLVSAERAADVVRLARVRCCLGELLIELGRAAEAVPLLNAVAALDEYDDKIAHERLEANRLIQSISATRP